MFKKKKGKKRKSMSLRSSEEQPDDMNKHEDVAAAIAINKKKQLVLKKVQKQYGLDSLLLYKKPASKSVKEAEAEVGIENDGSAAGNRSLGDRLGAQFSGAGRNGVGTEGVIASRHNNAMNDFINEGMAKKGIKIKMGADVEAVEEVVSSSTREREKLFGNLVVEVLGEGKGAAVVVVEGDTGAGGAILGGTGIAEVILPSEIRMKNAHDTALASQEREMKFKERKKSGGGISSGGGSYSHRSRKTIPVLICSTSF